MNNQLLETNRRKNETAFALSIDDYAKAHGLSSKQVWDFIEDGLIQAKNINNIIYIETCEKTPWLQEAQSCENLLPAVQQDITSSVSAGSALTKDRGEASNSRLLEAAQMIQNHVSMLESQLLSSKDDLIEEKNERIYALTQRLDEKDKEIENLRRALEDLETLNFALNYQVNSEVSK